MTLDELATEVLARLNLSAPGTETRIKRELQAANRKVSSAIGLLTSRRTTDTTTTAANDPQVTFDLEKLERVYVTSGGRSRVLDEDTYDVVKAANIEFGTTGLPQRFAVDRMGTDSVTIILDPIPDGAYEISADGYENAATLGDDDSPAFASDFHDVLIYDVLRVELLKMEKTPLAKQAEADYQQRLSDLRYFIIKSNSLSVIQGARGRRGILRPPVYRG